MLCISLLIYPLYLTYVSVEDQVSRVLQQHSEIAANHSPIPAWTSPKVSCHWALQAECSGKISYLQMNMHSAGFTATPCKPSNCAPSPALEEQLWKKHHHASRKSKGPNRMHGVALFLISTWFSIGLLSQLSQLVSLVVLHDELKGGFSLTSPQRVMHSLRYIN